MITGVWLWLSCLKHIYIQHNIHTVHNTTSLVRNFYIVRFCSWVKIFFNYCGIITNYAYYLAWKPNQDHCRYCQCIHVFQGVSLRLVSLHYGLVFAVFCGREGGRLLLGIQILLFSHMSRPVLDLTQPPAHWVSGMFPEGKAMGEWSWPLTSN